MGKYYAIEMEKEKISLGIYLYKSIGLIEVNESEEKEGYFIDDYDNEYVNLDEKTLIPYGNKVIGYLISEADLIETVDTNDLDDAKLLYSDIARNDVHVGFEIPDKGIGVITLCRDEIIEVINGMKDEEIKELPKELDKKFNDELGNFYQAGYVALITKNSVGDFKKAVALLGKGLLIMCEYIEKQDIDEHRKEKIMETIINHVDELEKLCNLDDLEEMKEKSREIYEKNDPKFKDIEIMLNKIIEDKEKEEYGKSKVGFDVKDIKKYFDEKIIGQDEAKKDVISAIVMNKFSKNSSDKNSCLLVGPTGSGKTLIAETVSEYFEMPMEIIDTTQLTMPGYVGANIEDFLARLIEKADGDIAKAEHGVVVFDEIDKKGSESNDDVSGKGVLNTLLPFLQGTTYNVKYRGKTVLFNTKDLTIFATGAFTDVAAQKQGVSNKKGYTQTRIGFVVDQVEDKKQEDIKYEKLEIEDFVKYGNMPIEIMGRFPVIAQLDGHTLESLKRILVESNISPLLSEKNKLEQIGIELEYTDEYLTKVAEAAFKLKTGARSLKTIVEKSIKEVRWEAISNITEYGKIVLDANTVENNLDCSLVDKNGEYHNLEEIRNPKVKVKK